MSHLDSNAPTLIHASTRVVAVMYVVQESHLFITLAHHACILTHTHTHTHVPTVLHYHVPIVPHYQVPTAPHFTYLQSHTTKYLLPHTITYLHSHTITYLYSHTHTRKHILHAHQISGTALFRGVARRIGSRGKQMAFGDLLGERWGFIGSNRGRGIQLLLAFEILVPWRIVRQWRIEKPQRVVQLQESIGQLRIIKSVAIL